ncbi:MAG: U32 family peptidase [Erysipelotrichaceae bacterium]|nr:U32 family peptidase [Erysipelotrichaceae bacterium]
MKKVELLAPAGNMEALIAAVNNGADAIYLGGLAFGARAFANNFNHENLIEAVNFCHIRNVCVYVTMNTLLYENELKKAMDEVDFLYKINVDAIIVQDLGLFTLIRKHYPDFEIHCSTQMHIHNKEAALFMKSKGANRVVLARETPLEIIKDVVSTGIDVEIFSYGALCMSYSGQCLMSSILQGRSGNRGVCAQHCRLPYKLFDETNSEYIETFKYLLSPKDLNMLDDINKLLDLNVSSLKIEGRMKRSEYVGLTVKIFRKAIDAYYNNEKFKLTDEELNQLKLMFNRGFTSGKTFKQNDDKFMNPERPNHIGLPIGKVVNFNKKYIDIKLDKDINQGDGIRILSDFDDHGLILNKIYFKGKLVNKGFKGNIISIEKREKVNINDKVVLTTDSILNEKIRLENNIFHKRIPLKIHVSAKVNNPLKIYVIENTHSIEVVSDEVLEQAKTASANYNSIFQQIDKLKDTPYFIDKLSVDIENVFIPIKLINDLRRKAIEQLNIKKINKYNRINKQEYILENIENKKTSFILSEINSIKQFEQLKNKNIKLFSNDLNVLNYSMKVNYLSNVVNENSTIIDREYIIASELGVLNCLNKSFIAGYNLNVTNSYALAFLLENNCDLVIYSLELDSVKIKMIEEAFYKRFNFYPNTATFIYGKRDLMITKQKVAYKGVSKKPGMIDLSHSFSLENDKKQKFPLIQDSKGFTHIIENDCFKYEGEVLTSNVFYRFIYEDNALKQIRRI